MKRKTIEKMLMALVLTGSMLATAALPGASAASVPITDSAPTYQSGGNDKYPVLLDANGNVYDLGGMEIIIRDWWSSGVEEAPENDYERATKEYRDWIQQTYNFKIKRLGISDWSTAPSDFVNYVSSGGDGNNYVFLLRNDPSLIEAMYSGMCYDLSTLSCLNFTESKFTRNLVHQKFSMGHHIFAMNDIDSEPRTGVFFNKRLLRDAGIDPETIYDHQSAGTWTWDVFENMLKQVERDTNNDGDIDVYGCNCNNGLLTEAAVYSAGGEFIGRDESGKYVCKLEDPKTLQGLNFAKKLFDNYWEKEPAGAEWDYYKEAFRNGEYVFMFEQAYAGTSSGFVYTMEDDWGFVMFPKPTEDDDYVNCWDNNFECIPACYDADRAWKIAFAWNLYTNETPGYENNDDWKKFYQTDVNTGHYGGTFDERAVNETLAMMRNKGMVTYHDMIPYIQFGPELTWNIGPNQAPIDTIVANVSSLWKACVRDENSRVETVTTKLGDNMFRLYNPNSGEHFYTASAIERGTLTSLGWKYEGIAWNAPSNTGMPVYRLYNPNSGDHHYTTYEDERDAVVAAGWIYEGIGWYSEANSGTPLYRLYNPNAQTGIHHYTSSAEERTNLLRLGWRDEGIGWYGRKR